MLATLRFANRRRDVIADRLIDVIVEQLGPERVLDAVGAASRLAVRPRTTARLRRQ